MMNERQCFIFQKCVNEGLYNKWICCGFDVFGICEAMRTTVSRDSSSMRGRDPVSWSARVLLDTRKVRASHHHHL